jgi:hypothetical protein
MAQPSPQSNSDDDRDPTAFHASRPGVRTVQVCDSGSGAVITLYWSAEGVSLIVGQGPVANLQPATAAYLAGHLAMAAGVTIG